MHAEEQLQQNTAVALVAFPHGSKQVLPQTEGSRRIVTGCVFAWLEACTATDVGELEDRALNRHLDKPD